MSELKKLPIGIQTFAKIREGDYAYVDKTVHIKRLVDSGDYYFLSRPRRFGKSLLLSTLQALFEGRRELFAGLYIDDKWDWNQTHPVIKISFGGVARDLADMKEDVVGILEENQRRLGIKCQRPEDLGGCLKQLIMEAAEKYGRKVVILVDEYDKFIVDNLDQPEVAGRGREVLKDLYTTIKDSDQYIHFAFLTGVSKFSKVSVFSGLNNLKDITLNPDFATICGYTQHDLETTFAGHLAGADMAKVREWYNGYNFLGEKVYNPFAILLFIDNGRVYDNYWFTTGTPTFLFKLIDKHQYFIPKLGNLRVSKSLIDSYDIDNIELEPILFQAGYLTIERLEMVGAVTMYVLCFPNLETRYSFNDQVLGHLAGGGSARAECQSRLFADLTTANLEGLHQTLQALFASISHTNYTRKPISAYEGYYASVVYAFFASLGLDLTAEDVTSTGRIDLSVRMDDVVYIFEFKVDGGGQALAQIKEKGYHEKYRGQGKSIYLIGIDFDSKQRNLAAFTWEKLP